MQIQADFDVPARACRRVFGDGFKKVGTDAQVLERESNDHLIVPRTADYRDLAKSSIKPSIDKNCVKCLDNYCTTHLGIPVCGAAGLSCPHKQWQRWQRTDSNAAHRRRK